MSAIFELLWVRILDESGYWSYKARLHDATKTCDVRQKHATSDKNMRRATKSLCVNGLICATCDCCMLSPERGMISTLLRQHATVACRTKKTELIRPRHTGRKTVKVCLHDATKLMRHSTCKNWKIASRYGFASGLSRP